jgi:fatty acid desaturase
MWLVIIVVIIVFLIVWFTFHTLVEYKYPGFYKEFRENRKNKSK